MIQSKGIRNYCQLTQNWHSRIGLLFMITLLLKPGIIETSHSWQRFSQYDNLMNPITFTQNINKDNNNKKSDNNQIDNTGNAVKHFNYRHISLGSVVPRQGSWKKWIPPISPSSLSSYSSPLYSSSSSSLYPPYSLHRSRQHNIDNGFQDNNCSRFEHNCHECRRHDCSFLQCDGPELLSTICLNVASPTFFSRPSIHKVLSQCHFIEQCPLSSQLSSKWMKSTSNVDRTQTLFGSKSMLKSSRDDLIQYPVSEKSHSSDSYTQRNLFSAPNSAEQNNNLNSISSDLSNYFNPSNSSSSSSSSSTSSSSSASSSIPHTSALLSDLSGPFSASISGSKDLSSRLFALSGSSYSITGKDDNHSGTIKSVDSSAAQRINDKQTFNYEQKNEQHLPKSQQFRKRVAMHRYSNTAWRHNGANDAIIASPLIADDSSLHRKVSQTPKFGHTIKRPPNVSAVHIGLGTIIALMLCSSLVLSAVLTVAYKKITKIYRNNRSGTYGVLQDE